MEAEDFLFPEFPIENKSAASLDACSSMSAELEGKAIPAVATSSQNDSSASAERKIAQIGKSSLVDDGASPREMAQGADNRLHSLGANTPYCDDVVRKAPLVMNQLGVRKRGRPCLSSAEKALRAELPLKILSN